MAQFTLTDGADVFPGAGVDTRGDDQILGLDGNDDINAGRGNDTVDGGEGDDLIKGGAGTDDLTGAAGADRIYGGDGGDIIAGGEDNDILWGQAGDDRMYGGAGDDVMYGGLDADIFDGEGGFDTVSYRYATDGVGVRLGVGDGYGEAFGDSFFSIEKFILSSFNDIFYGSPTAVTVLAGDGNDQAFGSASDDLLYGGLGNDSLEGLEGADKLYGDAGDDYLYGRAGDDVIYDVSGDTFANGHEGNDRIVINYGSAYGAEDNDVLTVTGAIPNFAYLYGGTGDDRLYGSNTIGSFNYLDGGEGDDLIQGGASLNTSIYGAEGADRLFTTGAASFDGGAGDDFMQGAAVATPGGDYFYGGLDVDTVSWANASAAVTIEGQGIDLRGTAGAATDDYAAEVERLELSQFGDTFRGDRGTNGYTVYGLGGSDVLYSAYNAASVLHGGDGSDMLFGGGMDDVLHSGAGNSDYLAGGDGADRIYLQQGTADGNGGDDVISLEGAFYAQANGWDGADKLYGSTSAAASGVLDGGEGDDVIQGRNGSYFLSGGDGADKLYGEGVNSFSGADGDDYMQGAATANAGDIFYGDAGIDTVSYRNAAEGVYIATSAASSSGAAARDEYFDVEVFALSQFNDSFIANLASPGASLTVHGYAGDDYIEAGASFDTFYGGAGDDELFGLGGADQLYGGADADWLMGGDGDDVLAGGAGEGDSLNGGSGADTFVFKVGDGSDAVGDFVMGEDLLDISDYVANGVSASVRQGLYGSFLEFSNRETQYFARLDAADLQSLVDAAYAVSPPPGAPAELSAPQLADPAGAAPAFLFAHGEWLLG